MRVKATVIALALVAGLAGCKSGDERAHEKAMASAQEKAAVTGVVQTLTYRDADGSMVTATIEPPRPGEATERVTVVPTK